MATKTWTGTSSTAWSTAANWSPSGVPASSDDVFIGSTTNSPTLSSTTTILSLTINGSDTLTLSSSPTLTVTNGTMLSSSGGVRGVGKLTSAVTASSTSTATITATGGTLEITGAIADNTSNNGTAFLKLAIGSAATDRLLLDAASTATSLTFAGTTGTLELNTNSSLTLTNALAVGSNTVKLDTGPGVPLLNVSAGITVSTGTITGYGNINAPVTATGAATLIGTNLQFDQNVTDAGGSLSLQIPGGGQIVLEGVTNTAHSLTFSGTNGRLFLSGGTTTLGSAITTGSNIIHFGDNATLTDTSGITLNGGTIECLGDGNKLDLLLRQAGRRSLRRQTVRLSLLRR